LDGDGNHFGDLATGEGGYNLMIGEGAATRKSFEGGEFNTVLSGDDLCSPGDLLIEKLKTTGGRAVKKPDKAKAEISCSACDFFSMIVRNNNSLVTTVSLCRFPALDVAVRSDNRRSRSRFCPSNIISAYENTKM
jgi:hypothetical protein